MDLDRETGELLLDITWLDETLVEPGFILGEKEAWVVSDCEFRPLSHRMPDSLRSIYHGQCGFHENKFLLFDE